MGSADVPDRLIARVFTHSNGLTETSPADVVLGACARLWDMYVQAEPDSPEEAKALTYYRALIDLLD